MAKIACDNLQDGCQEGSDLYDRRENNSKEYQIMKVDIPITEIIYRSASTYESTAPKD